MADFKGFSPYAGDLKTKIFKFYDRHIVVAKKLYKMMIQSAKSKLQVENEQKFTTVSIHIRLTDFGSHLERLFNLTLASPDYFTRAMQYFTDKYEVMFLHQPL